MLAYLLVDGVNSEPWTAPTYSVGRKGGRTYPQATKNPTLRIYQEALASEVDRILPSDWEMFEGDIECEMWFWRQLATYQSDAGRNVTRHRADRSNLLKATEDALQYDKANPERKCLFRNDKQILTGNTTIVAQGKEVEPRILIAVRDLGRFHRNTSHFAMDRAQAMSAGHLEFQIIDEEMP